MGLWVSIAPFCLSEREFRLLYGIVIVRWIMDKQERDSYIFQKKGLLLALFLFYYTNVPSDHVILRSFGFSFDPTCNFKAIVYSKKNHLHKYVIHIYESTARFNYRKRDVMGNRNIIKVSSVRGNDFYEPEASRNIYFDGREFFAIGYREGEKVSLRFRQNKESITDDILYHLDSDKSFKGKNSDATSFILYLRKLYTSSLNVDLVIGAGINEDYGGKSWMRLRDSLNSTFYQDDTRYADQIHHYVGEELFTSPMIRKTSGFDFYQCLDDELYSYDKEETFDNEQSSLYHCFEYLSSHTHTTVITYNYDTNLEYLLKKKDIRYTVVYDENSFVDKNARVDIYHVHGLLPYGKSKEKRFTDSLVFTESDYYYLYNNPYSWNIAKQLHDFKFHACLFIGISLTDPDRKRILELAKNYLKFNFIFLKKEKEYSTSVFRNLTSYFFTFDLIVIWVDDYAEIGDYLKRL